MDGTVEDHAQSAPPPLPRQPAAARSELGGEPAGVDCGVVEAAAAAAAAALAAIAALAAVAAIAAVAGRRGEARVVEQHQHLRPPELDMGLAA
eukprot:SAG22_NODE_152_length_17377_cov_191.856928_9_plen_93_part_00